MPFSAKIARIQREPAHWGNRFDGEVFLIAAHLLYINQSVWASFQTASNSSTK